MKSFSVRTLAAVVALCVILAAGKLFAEDVTITGVVHVTWSEGGEATATTLVVEEVVYNITLDDNGEILAGFDGKRVKIIGTVTEQAGVKWITVTSFEPVMGKD